MADNFSTPFGLVAGDELGDGTKVQRVKVQGGADGTAIDIPAHPTYGLSVEVKNPQLIVRPTNAVLNYVNRVNASAASVTLAATDADRKGLMVYNDSAMALLLRYGTPATATSFTVRIPAYGYWEMPAGMVYTGVVSGIWEHAAPTGAAQVTALTN